MKKSVPVAALVVLLFAIFPLVSAAVNSTVADNGFSCLANKTSDCSSLSVTEKIFTSLATGQCTDYVANSSKSNGCYYGPSSNSCDIKTTSQAILALDNSGRDSNSSSTWLLSKNQTTSDLQWYLQIDSNAATSCSIGYSGNTYTVSIAADKKLSGSAGSCLTVPSSSSKLSGYVLSVSSNCFGTNFDISCDQPFTTSKLYQRTPTADYPVVYVYPDKKSGSAGSSFTESVGSYCFSSGSGCDFESTLWALLALNNLQYNLSSYLPYITTRIDDSSNVKYRTLAYSVLNIISTGYKQDLLDQQKSVTSTGGNQYYWDSSVDKYFGTALALLSLQNQDANEKSNAIEWLSSVQGSDGCWNSDNKVDTAFLLYSLFGSRAVSSSSGQTSTFSCSTIGGYCLSYSNCQDKAGGKNLGDQYTCSSSSYICCDKDVSLPTCSSLNGQVCSASENCVNGTTPDASGLSIGEVCCVSGACIPAQQTQTTTDCELASGACRDSCFNNEQQSGDSCGVGSSQTCCVLSQQYASSPKTNWVLIIILSILVVLAALGIIFRKKLIPLWLKLKSKFTKGGNKGPAGFGQGPRGPGPGGRPFPPSHGPTAMNFRRPTAPRSQPQGQRPPGKKSSSDVNDVLKKLKEMSK